MINVNANVASAPGQTTKLVTGGNNSDGSKLDFGDTVRALEKYISKVDDLQQLSEVSVQELLSGKNEDITSVVSAVAKADMGFKLLVGVRNKLIEAYQQTMNMPL